MSFRAIKIFVDLVARKGKGVKEISIMIVQDKCF